MLTASRILTVREAQRYWSQLTYIWRMKSPATLGQHPRIAGKGKIVKVPIFLIKNCRCWNGQFSADRKILIGNLQESAYTKSTNSRALLSYELSKEEA